MDEPRASTWLTWTSIAACALLLAPIAPAVMLALWLGAGARVLHRPLTRALGGRARIAAGLTLTGCCLVLIPFLALVTSLAFEAYDLVEDLLRSPRGRVVLERLVAPEDPAAPGTSSLWDLALSHNARAWDLLLEIADTATRIVIALVVIVAGAYSFLIHGDRWYAWLERHAPIPPRMLRRLRDAFFETGRGLFIGIGSAGLLQAIVATLAYLALDVPHPLELGLLTFGVSIIPAVGTALVWAPVAAGLALTGRTDAAIVLAALGLAVIGTIDNVIRPFLARWGKLQLPTYVVLVTMFAGVQVLGGWGLLVGPLVVRLTRAVLEDGAAQAAA